MGLIHNFHAKKGALSFFEVWKGALKNFHSNFFFFNQASPLQVFVNGPLKGHWTIFYNFLYGLISFIMWKVIANLQIQKEKF